MNCVERGIDRGGRIACRYFLKTKFAHSTHTICPIGEKPIDNFFSIIYADKIDEKSYGWRVTAKIKRNDLRRYPVFSLVGRPIHICSLC